MARFDTVQICIDLDRYEAAGVDWDRFIVIPAAQGKFSRSSTTVPR
jgi:hypothetical protein